MPSTHFTVRTSLEPREVIAVLTDFGPDRAKVWPNIDADHFQVHEVGDDWAEVTEGVSMGWERERYAWDAAAGTVTIETLDSNIWAAGPGWRYVVTPTDGGSEVQVTLTRTGKNLKGRLVGALIPVVASKALGRQLQSVLRRAEGS
jgi:hypothetical protein